MNTTHFIGIGGSGMSALAQFLFLEGKQITGSDRLLDQGKKSAVLDKLKRLGLELYPQDGSGINRETSSVVVSTAIEENNPDRKQAQTLGIPTLHRSVLLAQYVQSYDTIAVAGTSGKSTVTAMIYEILFHADQDPSVITGGNLVLLEAQGMVGNAFRGRGDVLVIEGDESDGTLTRYRPWLGLVLNLDKDHQEPDELTGIFKKFEKHSKNLIINGDRPELVKLFPNAGTFGTGENCTCRAQDVEITPEGSSFTVDGNKIILKIPGKHNFENALAAIAACRFAGINLSLAGQALKGYLGVARRYQKIGEAGGVTVIDDFAHNPAKIAAALRTAQLQSNRVLAVYQPHGFAPTRFLKRELIKTFASVLRPQDILFMPEIYYVGGTAEKDISSGDIVKVVASAGKHARFFAHRKRIPEAIKKVTAPGDLVLVMGARDPDLPGFCGDILKLLKT